MLAIPVALTVLALVTLLSSQSRFGKILATPYQSIARMSSDRHRTWGIVYDSTTKQPIDPAHVTVQNRLGITVASAITDLDGRFGIIVPRGIYTLKVEKTHYVFPSTSLVGKSKDGHYTGLYFGGRFEVEGDDQTIAFAVPMDPAGHDWNQQEKSRTHSDLEVRAEVRHAAFVYFVIAGIVLVLQYFFTKNNQVTLLYLQVYAILLILGLVIEWIQYTGYYHSVVIDTATGTPLGFAKIKVFNHKSGIQVAAKTTSYTGQFVCLVPNGIYHVVIERRDAQGTYIPVHTSSAFRVSHRSIRRRFSV